MHKKNEDSWHRGHAYYENNSVNEYMKGEEWRRKVAQERLDLIEKVIAKGKLLEIGCATGLFLDEANKHNWEVHGIDPFEIAINFGREHYPDIHFQVGSDLSFWNDEFFDVIVCFDTLGYLDNPKTAIKEIARLLRPMGLLFMTNVYPNRVFFENASAQSFNYYFEKNTLHRILEKFGFFLIRSQLRAKNLNTQKLYTWGWIKHRFFPLNRTYIMMTYTTARRRRKDNYENYDSR